MDEKENRSLINWPMALTGLRLLMVPAFALAFKASILWSTAIIALAGLTDLLDGYLARRLKMTTTWGALLDPLADKLMLLTVLYNLSVYDYIPFMVFNLVLFKESAMILGAGLLFLKGGHIAAGWPGKVTTGLFFAAMLLIPLGYRPGIFFLYTALVLMVVAFMVYVSKFVRLLRPSRSFPG